MPRPLFITLKIAGVIAISLLVAVLATGAELSLHIGTFALVLIASSACFFVKSSSVRMQAACFLVLVVAVSHVVDRYFWVGVWDRGYPWPYSHGSDCTSCTGFIGSIVPFMSEVSVVCFSVLAAVAIIAIVWHLTHHSSGTVDLP
jgi:hypothetical protein